MHLFNLDPAAEKFDYTPSVDIRDLIGLDDVMDELGSREECEYVLKILEMGTGADRQLAVFQQTNDLKQVVNYIVEETSFGIR